jgi:L-threonylcarbamoyladenylate synthase
VKTRIVAADANRRSGRVLAEPAIAEVARLLGAGEIVALPTETVYGLAADALNAVAVAKIFEAKERPRFDPLIVHLPDQSWFEEVVNVDTPDNELVQKLANAFWPGPFTMVLPKKALVPDIVTAGLDTVAVRISAHPVFGEIIRAFGRPLAAPSANRFGRISPTTAEHVLDELGGRIPLIVDGGPTMHGLESTIVWVQHGKIAILRRGPVTADDLRGSGFRPEEEKQGRGNWLEADATTPLRAPGQLPSHYAPATPLRLVNHAEAFVSPPNQRVGLVAWNLVSAKEKFAAIRYLSAKQDLREAAANLFRYLRELDAGNLDLIVAERVPEKGLGAAINDRLRRAAAAAVWHGLPAD